MPIRKFIIFLFLIFGFSSLGMGQSLSNIRIGGKAIDSNSIHIDSLSILPNSFSLIGLDENQYIIDYISATIHILDSNAIGKSISYRYRVFSMDFSQKISHKSTDIILPKSGNYASRIQQISTLSEVWTDDMTLQSSGSIARGFSIGNNQDLVLSSTLNLQLSGMLSEDLEILANITDKNIPLQPEGNTQSIQDFDKIFIRLNYQKRFFLNAGDIEIGKPNGYFMVVNKQLLGMDFESNQKLNDRQKLYNKVGGGVNKGKYVRQTLNIINGVQGPYKLQGEQNEVNIIILSGSEHVYLDGRLLTRGQENDYIIDYNLGEITFTSNILITSEKRIVVEFEYKSNYYNHYTLYTYNEFTHEKNSKLKLNVNFTHDQDLKNSSIQPELNNDHKMFLSGLGDDLNDAYYPYIDSVGYNANEILYRKKDTIVNGESYTIYIHSLKDTTQLFRLGFTLMGNNNGDYVLEQSTTNGRIFRWIAPKNGIKQGNYEPVVLLSTPKSTQLGTVAAEYRFLKNSGIQAELAISNHDQNTFSKNDDKDNLGFAFKVLLFHENKLKSKKENEEKWRFLTQADYEYVHKNFYTTESYRDIEFSRNYNLTEYENVKSAEQMLHLQAGFKHADIGENLYRFNYYAKPGNVNAFRNEMVSSTRLNGFLFGTNTSWLLSNDSIQKTNFIQSNSFFSKSFNKIEIGISDLLERNIFREQHTDSLRSNSYAFNEARIFLKSNDSLPYIYNFSFLNRVEQIPQEQNLTTNIINNEALASFELAKLKNNRIRGTATFRNSQIKDSVGKFTSENFFVGSVNYTGRFFKNAIIITTYYEAGSGLEQQKTFSYLKVAEGQGTHTWNDYNHNGIEELEEFELAAFQDEANYIKIWITTPEYVITYNNQFTQTLQLRPQNVWSNKTGFRKFLSRFANSSTFTSSQKNSLKNSIKAFNPFQFNLEDSVLIRNTLNFINNLSFNQMSKYWGIDFIVQENQNKELLYYGFENNRNSIQEVIVRGHPHKMITLKCNYLHSIREIQSAYLASRNYTIETNHIESSINVQYNNALFGTLSYIFKHKENTENFEKALQHNIQFLFNYRMPQKGNLTSSIQYIHIKYNGETNSSIAYEMLEGLNTGHNALWSVGYQANITDYLQIELSYNGRISDGNKAVHTGNLQLRAHF